MTGENTDGQEILEKIRKTFESQLSMLHTDYTDMGFVHCIDEMSDYNQILSGGIWDYMKSLKREGVIRHLGLSSHDPEDYPPFP